MKKIMQWGLVVVLLGLLSTTENFAGACHSRRVDVEEVSPFVDEALAVNPVMFFPYGFSQTLGHLPSYSVACAQPDAVPLEFCPPPSYNVVREETAVEVYRETLGVLSQSEEILGAASDSGPNADYDDFIVQQVTPFKTCDSIEWEVDNFNAVSLNFGTLTIIQVPDGDPSTLKVTASANFLQFIQPRYVGRCLTLHLAGVALWQRQQPVVNYELRVSFLKLIKILGEGSVKFATDFRQDRLVIDASGVGFVTANTLTLQNCMICCSGKIEMIIRELHCQTLNAQLAGRGYIKIRSGEAQRQQIQLSGIGSIRFKHLQGESGDVVVRGNGKVDVAIKKQLLVTANFLRSVENHGEAKTLFFRF